MLTALAVLALESCDRAWARILAADFYVGAAYSRSDYLILKQLDAGVHCHARHQGTARWTGANHSARRCHSRSRRRFLEFFIWRWWDPKNGRVPGKGPLVKSLSITLAYRSYFGKIWLSMTVFALIGLGICAARRRFH